jgi:bifunctional N-acetylglucosamine-1-phosphate-uridyltransferase/glucosamine-1-phosphate-acetyltransferase GlmU-like protein
MTAKIILVPAAGMGSRLRSPIPKIFTPIFNKKCIMEQIIIPSTEYVDWVILLLNNEGLQYFNSFFLHLVPKNLLVCVQESPTGMFDALNIMFDRILQDNQNDFDVIIQWGDQPFCDREMHHVLFNDLKTHDVSVPIYWTSNPYVQFKFSEKLRISESREGERCDKAGFKDMGVFAFKRQVIEKTWSNYSLKARKGEITNGRNFVKYFELLSGEFNICWRLDQPSYKSLGFNTKKELSEIKNIVKQFDFI